jgi:squalene-hopene/tetraprenyl-beta-curcumene cyclase
MGRDAIASVTAVKISSEAAGAESASGAESPGAVGASRGPGIFVTDGMGNAAQTALRRAVAALLEKQKADGHWCGELEGDSILESEYLLMKFILGQEADPDLVKIANHLRRLHVPEGGWNLYPGGPDDLSATVKGYFALKLMGDDPSLPHMESARRACLRLGGAERVNSFSMFYLAAPGQVSYSACPTIPPEIVFLPRWIYFNLYAVSAWTRTMILPLSLVTTLRPVRQVSKGRGISELFALSPRAAVLGGGLRGVPRNWRDVFLYVDRLLKRYEKSPNKQLRARAITSSRQWLMDHMKGSDGLGAIFPPMVYMLIVLRALGYSDDDELVRSGHRQLKEFYIEEGDAIRLQPCLSPVWDTGIALHALAEAGLPAESEAAARATQWLLEKECRTASDWQVNCRPVEASGWFFEYSNPHYPDVDDTAMAVMAMRRTGGTAAAAAIGRGVRWLLAMQNDDGGWAAFDRTRDRGLLEKIPFADHNAMQDPSCPDITGRTLEGLGHCGYRTDHKAIGRAIAYLRTTQDSAGGWWGRWGVNFVYGTWQVLSGLKSVGESMDAQYVQRAARWLEHCQKPDGSWGETCGSYDNPLLKGTGDSTPSQTAWGTMGLLVARGPDDPAAQKGIRWLIDHQLADGSWAETNCTGTGFPRVFYLKYHLYRLYFPLMALAKFGRMRDGKCD